MDEVVVYFTYPQPAAYFAWHLATRKPEAFPGVRFRWVPVLYRRLMALGGADANGSPPLALKYMYADAARWATAHGIPFAAPHRAAPTDQTAHKVHLLAQQADAHEAGGRKTGGASNVGGASWEGRWMEAMHLAVRRDGMDPTDAAKVLELASLVQVPGIERVGDPALDERLEANTQDALRAEAPTVPFCCFDGEAFAGIDGLEWLSARLQGLAMPRRL